LIVPTDEESAPGVTQAISGLASRYPSRAIVLVSDPDEATASLEVSLSAFCSIRGGSGQVCAEVVTIHAEGSAASHPESFAGPLLVPDLPASLWYPGGHVPDATDGLVALANRLILDSAAAGDPEASLRAAQALLRCLGSEDAPEVGDLQWTALSPWRTLVADLFASPEGAEDLGRIRRVEILHDVTPSGDAQALLLVAWLSNALGWRPEPSNGTGDGGRELLFSGPSGEDITVTLDSTGTGAPLRRVLLHAGDRVYGVERQGTDDARATVMRGEDLLGERTVRLGSQEPGDLLGEELHFLGRDEVYEAALARAVELLDL
jgi:glucose-6-phosphate dehydrogenase assembly protein OpcA